MKVFRGLLTNFSVLGSVFHMLWAHKLWWLIPMVTVLLVFGLLLVFATTTGLGPFIYTLF